MCSDPKKKVSSTEVFMEVDAQKKQAAGDGFYNNTSLLLELSAVNDLTGFKRALEEEGRDVNKSCFWYGRRIGSKKMGFEERTPLMIASMFGSVDVLNFILQTGLVVDVNRAYGSDGATALHCAAAGGSSSSVEVVKLLIGSLADINCVDAQGNRPCDVIPLSLSSSSKSRRKALEVLLKGECAEGQASLISDPELGLEEVSLNKKADVEVLSSPTSSDGSGTEKKEYPVDPSLPDIKNGIYSTDEFRMYIFKVKPCSRAYSHDWTECPFVHPGENARRRDPRKYHYSCVPCPDFRKGTCNKGDACEYAHGIFECWLHPAQYRTRLCKDEINCSRRVCFFAHKPEELRPVYASTGSGMPSPRSMSSIGSPFDMASSLSPLALGSPSVLLPSVSTPPMTPTSSSSPMAGGNMWQNQFNVITPPPNLQLPGSRLKTALNARDVELRAELQDLENQRRKQQLLEELAALSSPRSWNSGSFSNGGALATTHGSLKPSNLDDMFGSSLDATFLAQSPTGMQIRQNLGQQTRANYSSTLCSSPTRGSSSSLGLDPSGVSNPRLAAFAKRSQSFIDRSAMANRLFGFSSPAPSSPTVMGSPRKFPEWGSPDGKLDWGLHGEELSKLRKSASFGFHNSGSHGNAVNSSLPAEFGKEPDLSWVQSIAKDAPMGKSAELGFDDELKQRRQYRLNSGGSEMIPSWAEQLYKEQEQTVA